MKRAFTLTLLLTLMIAATIGFAQSQSDTATEQNTTPTEVPQFDSQTYVRVGHFVPDGPNVDVFIDGEFVAEDVAFTQLSPWSIMEAGEHTIRLTPTGEEETLLETTVSLPADRWQIIGALGSGDGSLITTQIEQAVYTELPTTAQVSFANAFSSDDSVSFTRDETIFISSLGVITRDTVMQSVPTDAVTFNYGLSIGGEALVETVEVDVVDTSSYLMVSVGTPDDAQLVIDETPAWRIRLLDGSLPAPGTLLQTAGTQPIMGPFLDAVTEAGLEDLLTSEGPYTIFAPADYVMDDVSLSGDELANLLRYHIVEGNFKAGDLFLQGATLTTIDGDTLELTQTEQGFVNGAQIIQVNKAGSNGTIHIINAVLSPPE